MPCYEARDEGCRLDDRLAIAGLCAVLTLLDSFRMLPWLFSVVNFEKSGLTRDQLLGWWNRHKVRDSLKGDSHE